MTSLDTTTGLVHTTAVIETKELGSGTAVGSFSRLAAGSRVGRNCTIGDHVGVLSGAAIGDRVDIGFGCCVGSGAVLEDDVHLGSHVSVAAVPVRRSATLEGRSDVTTLRRGVRIGSGTVLECGVVVGTNAIVEPGAVVNRDIPANAIVAGNPASIRGYVTALRSPTGSLPAAGGLLPSVDVSGVALYSLPIIKDIRGTLSAGEFNRALPFVARRYFIVYDVSDHEVRGEHAHRKLHQFLVCVKGSVSVVVDDGNRREEILLDSPSIGIHVPPLIWATQYKYSRDAVLLVLASEVYDADDYIRSYDEYLTLRAREVPADG